MVMSGDSIRIAGFGLRAALAASVFGIATGFGAWTSAPALAASCPSVADPQGLKTAFPQQGELGEIEGATKKKLSFAENPLFADRVKAGQLPAVKDSCNFLSGTESRNENLPLLVRRRPTRYAPLPSMTPRSFASERTYVPDEQCTSITTSGGAHSSTSR